MKIQRKVLGKILVSAFVFCTVSGHIVAWAPTNFFRPDDPALHVAYVPKNKYLIGMHAEFGSRKTGLDASGTRQNVLAIHDETQSVVSMLMNGVTATDLPDTVGDAIDLDGFLIKDNQNPPIGRLKFNGKYEESDITFFARYVFDTGVVPGAFALAFSLPIKKKEIKNFSFEDLTKTYMYGNDAQYLQDTIIKDPKGDFFVSYVKSHGDLLLEDCRNSGFGDFAVSLEWFKLFTMDAQSENDKKFKKPKNRKNAENNGPVNAFTFWAKAGVQLPTGKERDENSAFSIALGNDGLWGFPCGAGLDMNFAEKIGAGLAFDVTFFADRTETYRLKTHKNQTDFLLLNTGRATKDLGLTWDFVAYLKAFHIVSHFDARVMYQFVTHQDDELFSQNELFHNEIINSASSLKGWYVHNLIFSLEYDLERDKTRRKIVPEFSLFCKLPLGGESVIDMYTFGGQLSVSF